MTVAAPAPVAVRRSAQTLANSASACGGETPVSLLTTEQNPTANQIDAVDWRILSAFELSQSPPKQPINVNYTDLSQPIKNGSERTDEGSEQGC